ncbi:HAD domain-containing protein [Massilia sp. W12]|uniref:HAD domain-containing protein n=1 Tax=Massilia sp. W12 TaxID=3126507 RepID=UPI0030CAA1E3
MRHILFLDFDGVLHAESDMRFARMPQFAACVAALPALEIVISSTWRSMRPISQLQEAFPPAIRMRVIGGTPSLPRAHTLQGGIRQREIEAWLENNRINHSNGHWIALDDRAELFDPDCPYLLLHDGRRGFGEREAALLTRWYQQQQTA